MVRAALIWLSSPPSITVRTCHIITSELNTTNAPEIARLRAGICRMKLATTAIIRTTPPIAKKRPSEFIFIVVRRAIADIVKNGIYLSGGGALLRGIDKRLTDKINIPFHIAEDPLHSVAKGAGIALKNVDRFSFLMR